MNMKQILLSVYLVYFALPFSFGQAEIQEYKQQIRTYEFGDPSPVPIIASQSIWGKGHMLYPYFYFNHFSTSLTNKTWTAVKMENPYIEVTVLPEEGGKIWTAIDKQSGHAFLHNNSTRKFIPIGLRGPWTAGGIEFNFGIIGHTPTGCAPVDYLCRNNPDGSVSCIVGNIDLPSRTRWSVEIRLPADKAYFETKAFWHNPTDSNQSYYAWMNASATVSDRMQFSWPGTMRVSHDYSTPPVPWPVDHSGVDRSLYANSNFGNGLGKSYFCFGEYENHYGCYWPEKELGLGHWALYSDVPGKKMWIFTTSREGELWKDLSTDDDLQYFEPQAGRLYNQNDHEYLAPQITDQWREVWFPYKNIGLMTKASEDIVMHLEESRNTTLLRLYALDRIDDELSVSIGDKNVFRQHIVLAPQGIYEKRFDWIDTDKKLKLTVGSKLYYCHDPAENDIHRPIVFDIPADETTEDAFQAGELYNKSRNYHAAMNQYQKVLDKEPRHIRALVRLSEIYARNCNYRQALDYAGRALAVNKYDPSANYTYGVAARKTGDKVDALETFGWAARSLEFRSAAYCQMAEIYLQDNNLELADEYIRRSLDFNRLNVTALQVAALVQRKRNHIAGADSTLKMILDIEPLNHFARFERYVMNSTSDALDEYRRMNRSELAHESFLELALFYNRLGQTKEAMTILELAPDNPMVCYWLAYLKRDIEKTISESYLNKANRHSPEGVFPFRGESIDVLKWAIEKSPDIWKPRYYLGLIYWYKDKRDEGRKLLDACSDAEYYVVHLCNAYITQQSDFCAALPLFEKALETGRDEWRAWHNLILYHHANAEFKKAYTFSKQACLLFPQNQNIRADYIRALSAVERYQDALDIMKDTVFIPQEGARELPELFINSHLMLALSDIRDEKYASAVHHLDLTDTYPENLGKGRPNEPDNRIQDYLKSVCYEQMNEPKKAQECRKKVLDYTYAHYYDRPSDFWSGRYMYYMGGFILKEVGHIQTGLDYFETQKELNRLTGRYYEWHVARLNHDRVKAREIEKEMLSNLNFQAEIKLYDWIDPME